MDDKKESKKEKLEPISLINKFVRTKNSETGEDVTGIVQFMYPDFIAKDEIFFDYENSIIYNGGYHPSLRDELEHGTKRYIAIVQDGMIDYDLTNRETAYNLLRSRSSYRLSAKGTIKYYTEFADSSEFWSFFKKRWILGKDYKPSVESMSALYELTSTMMEKSSYTLSKKYLELRKEGYSARTLFTVMTNFLMKSANPDETSISSAYYKAKLDRFQRQMLGQVRSIMEELIEMDCDSKKPSTLEMRNLWMVHRLGDGKYVQQSERDTIAG